MSHQCQCPGAGHCPRFNRDMNTRQHQICSGQYPPGVPAVSPDVRAAYLQLWGGNAPQVIARPKGGPGTELKKLLAELGIKPGKCGCNRLAAQMDDWGVKGCRLSQNREVILGQLRENYSHLKWSELIAAGFRALASGVVVSPLDPAAGVYEVALIRASNKD